MVLALYIVSETHFDSSHLTMWHHLRNDRNAIICQIDFRMSARAILHIYNNFQAINVRSYNNNNSDSSSNRGQNTPIYPLIWMLWQRYESMCLCGSGYSTYGLCGYHGHYTLSCDDQMGHHHRINKQDATKASQQKKNKTIANRTSVLSTYCQYVFSIVIRR